MINTDDSIDELVDTLCDAMGFVTNEAIILNKLEKYFSPKPAKLADSEESLNAIKLHVEKICKHFGGAPTAFIRINDEPIPKYDTYPNAAFDELFALFARTRVSVTRTQMFFIGSNIHQKMPNAFDLSDITLKENLIKKVDATFWEHAELSYIRLASYWDRVGQLMDFTFFGIRQYDRDGFSAVMDKIHNNWASVDPILREMAGWKALRSYQTSEKIDGLKWLLRRRNLLIHSMHLRPIELDDENSLFESAFNHLDRALRDKLKPESMENEMKRIHEHLSIAALQLTNILLVLEYATGVTFRPCPK